MHPSLRAFWAEYRAGAQRPPSLVSATELAAVRLLQTAVEIARGLPDISAPVMAIVQVADNMLRDPKAAALDLMGLRE